MTAKPARAPRFGIQLQPQRTSWPDYIAAVKRVEAMGYDSIWNFDHMLPFAGDPAQPCFETWTTLTAIAMATSRVRIGALVNGVMYRDPATLAKSAATVDQISGGRLEFALGAAWAEREFRAYGLPFPPVGERMARLEEALEIVESLMTQPRTTYEGRYYQINDAPFEPKAIQQPYPPIMIGGNGPRTIRIAAKHANIWNGFGSPDEITERVELLKTECEKIGRSIDEIELSCHPLMSIARSREDAERKARETSARVDEDFEAGRARWLLGASEDVRAQVRGYVDVGVTYLIIAMGAPFDFESLELFAHEVTPTFR